MFATRDYFGKPVFGVWVAGVYIMTLTSFVSAGFLEMPDTAEVPEYERESLLLDMDIPPLRDRDPNPEAGPRLNVKEFRVQGLVEYPDLGITREEIVKRVEAIRFDMMGEGKLLDSGYTPEELKEVSDLIAEIEKETEGRHVGSVEVQKLVFLIREQRRQRGITLGMIEGVADTITRYYRERGFILAKAYIPKQHVRDGIVTITLLLGELGEVNVQNNKRYSNSLISRSFKSALGKPVTNARIEESLYLVNDLPGMRASGYFEPGSQIGDTKLNVNVSGEDWYDANMRIDNHGAERSGEYRAYSDFYLHNPLTIGDQLHLGVLGSFSPENSTYGSIRYLVPIYSPRATFTVGAGNNQFAFKLDSLGIQGESLTIDSAVKYKLRRTRAINHSIGLKASAIDSTVKSQGVLNTDIVDSKVNNLEVFYEYDVLNEKKRVLQQGAVALTFSTIGDDALEDERKAVIFSFDYSRLSFVDIPFLQKNAKYITRSSGAYSDAIVAPVSQFSLGGPNRSRGFTINEFSADSALFVGADLLFDGPSINGFKLGGESVSSILQPFIFTDLSYGFKYELPESDSAYAYLVDAGVGIKIDFKDSISGNIVFAWPISAKDSSLEIDNTSTDSSTVDKTPGDGLKIYFDMQVGF